MIIHDISVEVSNTMVIWPGLIPTNLSEHERIQKGAQVNVTNLSSCAHVGTHVDAPFHHYGDGITIEQMPLQGFIGKAFVADLTHVEWAISKEDITRALKGSESFDILILKTRNSTELTTWEKFEENYVYISAEGAEEIVNRGIKTIAFDHLAVEGYNIPGAPTHKIFLGKAGVTIIEGVNLKEIHPGYYFFSSPPVKLKGSDGSPARAYLIEDPSGALLKGWESAKL